MQHSHLNGEEILLVWEFFEESFTIEHLTMEPLKLTVHLQRSTTTFFHRVHGSANQCAFQYPMLCLTAQSTSQGNQSRLHASGHRQVFAAMEANVRFITPFIALFFLLSCCYNVFPAFCFVNDKCSACQAVALELEESLANEEPRNHLDYRHRLDSKGQRQGRVIDYRVSELRVVDLLDGLCAKMSPYVPNQAGPGREFWVKVDGGVPDAPEMAFNRQATELHSRAIVEFCGRLLETTEEELTEKLRAGEVTTGGVERVLCRELSKSCKETARSAPLHEDLDHDDLDDEEHERSVRSDVSEDAANLGSDGEL